MSMINSKKQSLPKNGLYALIAAMVLSFGGTTVAMADDDYETDYETEYDSDSDNGDYDVDTDTDNDDYDTDTDTDD